MATVGDLVATLALDVRSFIVPLDQATIASRQSSQQITASLSEQQKSWSDLAAVAGATAAGVVAAETAMATARLAGRAAISAGRFAADHALEVAGAAAASGALLRYAGVVNSVARMVIPQYRAIGAAVGLGLAATNIARTDAGQSAISSIVEQSRVPEAIGRIQNSIGKLTNEIKGTATSAIGDLAGGLARVAWEATGAQELIDSAGNRINAWSKDVATSIDGVTTTVRSYGDGLETILFATSKLGQATDTQVSAFYQEAEALRDLRKESDNLIYTLSSQRSSYTMLWQIQQDAMDAASHASDLDNIRSLKTLEDIDREINARRAAAQASVEAAAKVGEAAEAAALKEGKSAKEAAEAGFKAREQSLASTKQIFNALYAQREGVTSGKIKESEATTHGGSFGTPEDIQSTIDAAKLAINELKYGAINAALLSAQKKGANEEELAQLHQLLDQKEQLKKADEAGKTAAEQAKRIAEDRKRNEENATKQVEHLKDQYLQLSGAISKGELARRDALRGGATETAASDIKNITDATETFNKTKDQKSTSDNKVALRGSSEAAEVVLKALNGDTTEKIQREQLDIQKKLLAAWLNKTTSFGASPGKDLG